MRISILSLARSPAALAVLLAGCAPSLGDDDDGSPPPGDDDDASPGDDDDDIDDDDVTTGDDDDDDDDVTPEPYVENYSAGWWFGNCAGACLGDLVFPELGPQVAYVIRNWDDPEDFLFGADGELTPEAHEELLALLAAVDTGLLEPTYGCPDCADGGGQYMQWDFGPVAFRSDYEFGDPPAVLADLDLFVLQVQRELTSCDFDRVQPQPCEPWEP